MEENTQFKGTVLCPAGAESLKGKTDFYEILRASPFNKELTNDTTFSLIHLAGQYL